MVKKKIEVRHIITLEEIVKKFSISGNVSNFFIPPKSRNRLVVVTDGKNSK